MDGWKPNTCRGGTAHGQSPGPCAGSQRRSRTPRGRDGQRACGRGPVEGRRRRPDLPRPRRRLLLPPAHHGQPLGINVADQHLPTAAANIDAHALAMAWSMRARGCARPSCAGTAATPGRDHRRRRADPRRPHPRRPGGPEFGPEFGYIGRRGHTRSPPAPHAPVRHDEGAARVDRRGVPSARVPEPCRAGPHAADDGPVPRRPPVVDPFAMYDCSLITDGAGAVVVTSADRARHLPRPPVYVRGFGSFNNLRGWLEDDHMVNTAARESGRAAFASAGVGPGDVSTVQLYDCFTHMALVQLEDYGFCTRVRAARSPPPARWRSAARCPRTRRADSSPRATSRGCCRSWKPSASCATPTRPTGRCPARSPSSAGTGGTRCVTRP